LSLSRYLAFFSIYDVILTALEDCLLLAVEQVVTKLMGLSKANSPRGLHGVVVEQAPSTLVIVGE